MPSYPEGSMNLNSGVGDNAAGRYFGGRGGGRGSGMSSRQMRNYMQMRRDEMSHGAFLSNQNDSLKSDRDENRGQREADKQFNRDSLRIDGNTQQVDWEKNRDTVRQSASRWDANRVVTDFGKNNPHGTSFDADNARGSWDPRFAPEGDKTGGGKPDGPRYVPSVQVDPPAIAAPPSVPKPKSTRVTKRDVETAVRGGFYTAEEANDDGTGKPLNAAYTRAYARSAASSPDKTARGRQFQGPQTGGTPAGSPAPNYDTAPKPVI